MGFLDWIKNRNAAPTQAFVEKSQSPEPETAKQMYTRQDAEAKAAAKPIAPEVKSEADRAMGGIREALQEMQSPQRAPAPETAGSPAAQMQNQNHQDKTQAALSPTDGTAGKTASQEKPKAPEKARQRIQTIARRPPSWER